MQINAGPPVTGSDFFSGRRGSVEQLRKMLGNADVLLVGPRRTGKTSVVKEYLNQEKANPSFCSSFIDLEEIENLYDFYARITQEIYSEAEKVGALTSGAKEAAKELSNLLSKVFPNGFDLSVIPGAPKMVLKAPSFDPLTVEQLRKKVGDLLVQLSKPFTFVLDEFPEVIWKLGRQAATEEGQDRQRKDEARFLLEGLRTLRQRDGQKQHRVIIAGSVNLKNTVEHLELSQLINDLPDLLIPYLDSEGAYTLFKELGEAEDFKFSTDANEHQFIQKQFGKCSPFYIQFFAERLRQLKFSNPSLEIFSERELKKAYLDVLMDQRGPAYLLTRLKRYYTPSEREAALELIKFIAEQQFNEQRSPSEEECFTHLAEKTKLDYPRIKQSALIAKLYADNLVETVDAGSWCFESAVISAFWHYRLVGARFLR